jgi:hypothetical protein
MFERAGATLIIEGEIADEFPGRVFAGVYGGAFLVGFDALFQSVVKPTYRWDGSARLMSK